MGEIKKMQGHLSTRLAKYGLVHRSLGFDYQLIETLQIKPILIENHYKPQSHCLTTRLIDEKTIIERNINLKQKNENIKNKKAKISLESCINNCI